MHINSTAPQAPEQNKFAIGRFLVEHRLSPQHPAGLYSVSVNGRRIGQQYSMPSLADCERMANQLRHSEEAAAPIPIKRGPGRPRLTGSADVRPTASPTDTGGGRGMRTKKILAGMGTAS